MSEENYNIPKISTDRVVSIRLRTWTATLAIALALVFYSIMQVALNKNIDVVQLVFTAIVQVATHFIYYPEGERYGQQDKTYIANKRLYNEKATAINEKRQVDKLREYCIVEFEERKQQWLLDQCGTIGITLEDYNALKGTLNEKSDLSEISVNGKLVYLTKGQIKALKSVLWGKCPVEPNEARTIMSACSHSIVKAIADESKTYSAQQHITKIFMATVVATFLAFIGYKFQDGITLEEIANLVILIANMITTAVLSYSAGEKAYAYYKNRFYVDLALFIDNFNSWNK